MRYTSLLIFAFLIVIISATWPTRAKAADEFGVIGAVPSLSSDSAKQQAVDLMVDLGAGWNRHEFFYMDSMDFAPYDAAQSKLDAKNIKTLGLLSYPGTDKNHDDWKRYVQSVVSHYGSRIPAWEIMNEPDNYLSGADYVQYAQEAHDIIKQINPGATIVLGGITSRPETPNFWNAVSAANGWGLFDVVGLHVYHAGSPETVNFGGGDLLAEYDRAVAALRRLGSKKIWITETGYKASDTGNEDQGNWLARTVTMSRSVPSVERIFIYRLYDDSRATYGLTGSNLSPRPAYGVMKTTFAALAGRGTGSRQYPQQQTVIDGLESTNGWNTEATTNGSLSLSTVGGKSGQAMQLKYNFNADQAYAVAEKRIAISGTPQALGIWINGDDTKNVWKFRFTDKNNETFQTDLGTTTSGWNYKQFTIGQDGAIVSWGGDGKIDYPISFNAIVVDRQSSDASGTGTIDDLTAISGGADLYAFLFGNRLAYWKVSGSTSLDFCGASRNFTTTPQFADGVSCDSSAAQPLVPTQATTVAAKASPIPKASPSPVVPPDPKQSTVRVDGANIVADGQQQYRIVMLVKDTQGHLLKTVKPTLTVSGNAATLKMSDVTLVGDEWWAYISSTEVGERTVKIVVQNIELASPGLTFVAMPSPTPLPSPSPTLLPRPVTSPPLVVANHSSQKLLWWALGTLLTLIIGAVAGYYFWRRRRLATKA